MGRPSQHSAPRDGTPGHLRAGQTLDEPPRGRRESILPLLAISVTVVLWASAFVAIRQVTREISPGSLTLGLRLVGSVALGVFVLLPVHRPRDGGRPGWPVGRLWVRVVVCGVLWFAVYNVALNAGEQRVDAGTAAMLISVGPILIAVVSGATLGERFGRMFVIGAAVSFAGVVMIGVAASHGRHADLAGVLLCLVAALAYAIAVVAQKPVLASVSALRVTWLTCTIGAICCLPFSGQLLGELGQAPAQAIWLLVYLGTLPTALGFTTWAYALARTGAGRLGMSTYLVPPLAVLMGWILLGETPVPLAYAGGALCLVGVTIGRRREPQQRPSSPHRARIRRDARANP